MCLLLRFVQRANENWEVLNQLSTYQLRKKDPVLKARESACVDVWYFLLSSVCFLQQATKKLTSLELELSTAKKLELSVCNTCFSYRLNLFSSSLFASRNSASGSGCAFVTVRSMYG
jgi:hypothetical protein